MTKKFGSLSQEFQPLGFAWPSPVCLRAYGEVNRHMKRSLCFIKKKKVEIRNTLKNLPH